MREASMLDNCLVEGDQTETSRSRLEALLASLVLQAGVVCGMLLVPILAPAELPRVLRVTPALPYRGASRGPQKALQRGASSHQAPKNKSHLPVWMYQPAQIPKGTPAVDGAAQGVAPPIESGPPGDPNGPVPWIGRGESGRWIPPLPHRVKPPEPRPITVSEGVQQARLVHRVQPDYPSLAKQIGLDGTVQLRAIIGRDGKVRSLELLSGHPLLAKAALDAVGEWRYQPTLLSGEPVEVETYVTVVFQLHR